VKTAIIDLDSVAYSIGHPNKVLGVDGEPLRQDEKFVYMDKTEDELRNAAHYWINKILTDTQATHYIAFIKGKNTITSRKEVADTYKSNRKIEQPKWWVFVKNYLVWEFRAVEVHDMEVDDAVNITRLQVPDSFICAMDKDLLGLEGNHYNWRKEEWVYTNKDEAYIKFWSDMIIGQSGDGIKGIPGKGIKTVEQILKHTDSLESSSLLRSMVLENYIGHFGEYIGIKEFYKNYIQLKILDVYEGFEIPEPICVK